jgi:hypothetical protein
VRKVMQNIRLDMIVRVIQITTEHNQIGPQLLNRFRNPAAGINKIGTTTKEVKVREYKIFHFGP